MADGATHRDHLLGVETKTGKLLPELHGAPPPPDGAHVWVWFLRLHRARGSNGWGPNPVSYQDVAAWVKLTQTIIRPTEVEAIMILDSVWLTAQAKSARQQQESKRQQSISAGKTRTTRRAH